MLARVYPNGQADVNHFEQAGGLAYITNQLRSIGLLNEDVVNVMGQGLDAYECKPELVEKEQNDQGLLGWSAPVNNSGDTEILASADKPFASEGGMRMVTGNLGTGVVKVSAVDEQYQSIEAPCKIFETQDALKTAFDNGELNCDHISVVRFQGPAANGMPELHKLTPYLGILQDKGFKVALLTDGRMSGASGKVLSAIHVSPEAKSGGLLAYLQDGDMLRIDCQSGQISSLVSESDLRQRQAAQAPKSTNTLGRGLFENMRAVVSESTSGASFFS